MSKVTWKAMIKRFKPAREKYLTTTQEQHLSDRQDLYSIGVALQRYNVQSTLSGDMEGEIFCRLAKESLDRIRLRFGIENE
jgi:hypothetical protein